MFKGSGNGITRVVAVALAATVLSTMAVAEAQVAPEDPGTQGPGSTANTLSTVDPDAPPGAPTTVPAPPVTTTPPSTGTPPTTSTTATSLAGGEVEQDPVGALDGSSPDDAGEVRAQEAVPFGALTFSRIAVNTQVRGQYRMTGIRFSGDRPFITTDTAQPSSPVLSGTPRFHGSIRGTFVRPQTGDPRTVDRLSLDVGYIDTPGSVKVILYGAGGQRIGDRSVNQRGVVRVTLAQAGIAAFEVKAIGSEPQGFTIDNLIFPGSDRQGLAALGDSYSSGEANPPFDALSGGCHTSSQAWPRRLANGSAINIVRHLACSGARTRDLHQSFRGFPAQLSRLSDLENLGLVTITIGGNDVGFADILTECYVISCWASLRLAVARAEVERLAGRIDDEYRSIRNAAPGAWVVVVGYPRLFPARASDVVRCGWLGNQERRDLNALAEQLDDRLRAAAQRAGVTYVSTLGVLSGHELCTDDSWVYRLNVTGGDARGHPIAAGQRAMEARVRSQLGL